MRCFAFALAAVLGLLAATPQAAFADSINQFRFDSHLSNGYEAQGLISIDVTVGQVTQSWFTLSQNGNVDAIFDQPNYAQPVNGAYLAQFADAAHGYTYELLLPQATLVNYTGGPVCLAAPGTSCLGATTNVGYCTTAGCVGTCNELASCGIQMDNGFCATPGTVSILVPVNTGMAV